MSRVIVSLSICCLVASASWIATGIAFSQQESQEESSVAATESIASHQEGETTAAENKTSGLNPTTNFSTTNNQEVVRPRRPVGPSQSYSNLQQGQKIYAPGDYNVNRVMLNPLQKSAQNKATRTAFQALKNAESKEDKRDAEDDLRDALEDEYESSLKVYEESLKVMAEKLQRLEEELEKRRSAKDELVDLRLKTLTNQAQGLGWPGEGLSTGNFDSFLYRAPSTNYSPGYRSKDGTQKSRTPATRGRDN